MTRLGDSDAAYVAAVLVLLCGLPDTPLRPSPADQTLARRLYQDAVPLPLVESALLLGTLRRLTRTTDLPPLPKIGSLGLLPAGDRRTEASAAARWLSRLPRPQASQPVHGSSA
jgi:hypothetical protein